MIDRSAIEKVLSEKLGALEVGKCIEIRTYKRNRAILFVRTGPGEFLVACDGYEKSEQTVGEKKLRKVIKTLLKREFPRSRKVRLYDLGEYDPEVHRTMERKTL
jgi:hypothetical protein